MKGKARFTLKVRADDGSTHSASGPDTDDRVFALWMLASGWGDDSSDDHRDEIAREMEDAAAAFVRAAKKYRASIAAGASTEGP